MVRAAIICHLFLMLSMRKCMLAPRSVCEVPVGNMKKNIKKKNINEIENEFYESDKIW